jgi:hypothetical protein
MTVTDRLGIRGQKNSVLNQKNSFLNLKRSVENSVTNHEYGDLPYANEHTHTVRVRRRGGIFLNK